MKISKVDHAKIAVGTLKNKDNQIGGIMYKDPNKNGRTADLNRRIDMLNEKSLPLYNIFVPIQNGQEPKRPNEKNFSNKDIYDQRLESYEIKKKNFDRRKNLMKKAKDINTVINDICFVKNRRDNIFEMNDNSEIIYSLSRNNLRNDIDDSDIEDYVSIALRKSLSKAKEGAVCLLKAIGNKNITDEDKKKIRNFLDIVRKDYSKLSDKEYKERIIRSIENQNLIIQPDDTIFSISCPTNEGKKTDHKEVEKEGFKKFLNAYSVLDESERMGVLRKLRRIVDLYFSTPDDYSSETSTDIPDVVDKTEFDVWAKHEKGKQKKGTFVDIPSEIIKGEKSAVDNVEGNEAKEKLEKSIRQKNINCYRYTLAVISNDKENLFFENNEINKFWVHHIENAVERLLKHRLTKNLFKLNNAYLSEKVWKDAINLLSVKYIAIGKAVYHFGMDELFKDDKDITLGNISNKVKNGISSFDYENIKASETLQRELAVNVSFAVNNLSRQTIDISNEKNTDLLTLNEEKIKNVLLTKEDEKLLRSILQFFGGASKWDSSLFKNAYKDEYGVEFLIDIKKMISDVRNESFHFTTSKTNNGNWNMELIGEMFKNEAKNCMSVEKTKFYSNNLPMFYTEKNLKEALDILYKMDAPRASQIPSFNSVVVRKKFPDYLSSTLKINSPGMSDEDLQKWHSACYYLLKEIYYNCFIQSPKAKEYFMEAVKEEYKRAESKKDRSKEDLNISRAMKDFKGRIEELNDYSLSEICQIIMTEYNFQNNQKRTVRSGKDSMLDEPIFEHYKMNLIRMMSVALAKYVNSMPEFDFIKIPSKREMKKVEEFLPEWKTAKYEKLVSNMKNDAELQKWYIMCRLLNSKMLNQLAGSLRSYIQYSESIKRRAKSTGNVMAKNDSVNVNRINKVLPVVDMCIKLVGVFSNELTDYFEDEEAYAKYLSKYINYNINNESISYAERLRSFCNDNRAEAFGIYYDGKNPILNRNIMMAKLYGPDKILQEVVTTIDEDEIVNYYEKLAKIDEYRTKAELKDEYEQQKVVDFQRIKNRVELRTHTDYSELINELFGQLINWSYLRERDLFYFQLGFHYTCLQNESEKPLEYKTITRKNGTTINNAILYQVAAMYIYGIKIFGKKKNGVFKISSGSTSEKIDAFFCYSEELCGDSEAIYNAGLEVFENINEHNNIIDLRNSIDHFHYYSGNGDSILKIYSEVFDRYFTYDMKYQKNVINLLDNILIRHNLLMDTKIETGEKKVGKGENAIVKPCAKITVTKLIADKFTFKLLNDETNKSDKKNKTCKLDAKNKEYIETVAKILYFPENPPSDIMPIERKIDNSRNSSKNNGYNNGRNNYKNNSRKNGGDDKRETTYSSGGLGNFPFANIKLN